MKLRGPRYSFGRMRRLLNVTLAIYEPVHNLTDVLGLGSNADHQAILRAAT